MLKKLKEIIDNLSLDDITVSEELDTSRTYGKLRLVKTVHVLPKVGFNYLLKISKFFLN